MLDAIGKVFRKGKINTEEVMKNCSLGQMILLKFQFYPWQEEVKPEYIAVEAKSVEIFEDEGVYVRYNEESEGSYVGKITSHCGYWGGIFNTKEEAEQCFKDTMAKWKANIP